jgi:hypothetical protein
MTLFALTDEALSFERKFSLSEAASASVQKLGYRDYLLRNSVFGFGRFGPKTARRP